MDPMLPVGGSAVSPGEDGGLFVEGPTVPPGVPQSSITSIRELEAELNNDLLKVKALDHITSNHTVLRKCASQACKLDACLDMFFERVGDLFLQDKHDDDLPYDFEKPQDSNIKDAALAWAKDELGKNLRRWAPEFFDQHCKGDWKISGDLDPVRRFVVWCEQHPSRHNNTSNNSSVLG